MVGIILVIAIILICYYFCKYLPQKEEKERQQQKEIRNAESPAVVHETETAKAVDSSNGFIVQIEHSEYFNHLYSEISHYVGEEIEKAKASPSANFHGINIKVNTTGICARTVYSVSDYKTILPPFSRVWFFEEDIQNKLSDDFGDLYAAYLRANLEKEYPFLKVENSVFPFAIALNLTPLHPQM